MVPAVESGYNNLSSYPGGAFCISHIANDHGKGINQTIYPLPTDKY